MREIRIKRKLYLSNKMPAIMVSTNVMNKPTENNKQTNCFLKIFIQKLISFTVKSNSRNTDWIVDRFPQVKSAEYMAKINTKIICLRSGAFHNFSWKLYQKYIKRLWNIYKYINFLSITYFPWAQCVKCKLKFTSKFFTIVADLVAVVRKINRRSAVKETRWKSSKVNFAA